MIKFCDKKKAPKHCSISAHYHEAKRDDKCIKKLEERSPRKFINQLYFFQFKKDYKSSPWDRKRDTESLKIKIKKVKIKFQVERNHAENLCKSERYDDGEGSIKRNKHCHSSFKFPASLVHFHRYASSHTLLFSCIIFLGEKMEFH